MATGKRPSITLALLDPNASDEPFPPLEHAWEEPNGLIAFGGDLSPTRLINAYKSGIFPWYNPDEPIYWWTPNPRAVLFPELIKISKSLRKSMRSIKNKGYQIRFDTDFTAVVNSCAAPRAQSAGTWISDEMNDAYYRLFKMGLAHSVEIWNGDNELVGGLYGVVSGGVFSGESMFSTERDVSKIAFVALAWHIKHWGFSVIDCQIENSHLTSLGVINISRKKYQQILNTCRYFKHEDWVFEEDCDLAHWQPDRELDY
ncbi:MAG: leucyl/phenylalanyl-tRNA--protein transferase [Cocleimonas sp.]